MFGEGAGIDGFDAEDVVFFKVVCERLSGAPVGGDVTEFFDDEGADVRPGGFVISRVDAVVADHRVCHCDDLAPV